MLGINTQGTRNSIQEDMLTKPGGIGHLNDEYAEGIQAAYGGYANRTLANGIFVVMRLQQKRLVSLMYWFKYQRRIGKTTEISNDIDEPTLRMIIEGANELESRRKE